MCIRDRPQPPRPTYYALPPPENEKMTAALTVSESSNNNESGGVLSKDHKNPFPGLKNLGNSCYMNAVLQILINTREIAQTIINGDFYDNIVPNNKGIANSFADVANRLISEHNQFEDPSDLKNVFERYVPQFAGHEQQDAQEFMRTFMDLLHEDMNKIQAPSKETVAAITRELEDSTDMKPIVKFQRWVNSPLAGGNSYIKYLFAGALANTLNCSHCHGGTTSFETFWELSLSLEILHSNALDLSTALDDYFKDEILEQSLTCRQCRQISTFTKKFDLCQPPRILTIHLKRFYFTEHGRMKINTPVKIPTDNLNLSKYVHREFKSRVHPDWCTYRLYAIINHVGDLNYGHYTTDCFNFDEGVFYRFNDDKVYANNEEVRTAAANGSPSAYILVYVNEESIARQGTGPFQAIKRSTSPPATTESKSQGCW
eukprot:TRINITY_DN2164_c0_g1_i4.p1 TRINITY_DN2164_c0_g1~~TRINITY_DN2164_c0_g1_i4.p1  ORF type:complete len:430 (+),score=90.94 TRINITY_DN2164_c0_g1_i4:65-1354(+)